MRPGCVRVETKGSFWWFDESAHEYMRLPKHEAPRERPEWGGPDAGPLQDAVWHPYERWEIGPHPSYDPNRVFEVAPLRRDGAPPITFTAVVRDDPTEGLMIYLPGQDDPTWAPHAQVLS